MVKAPVPSPLVISGFLLPCNYRTTLSYGLEYLLKMHEHTLEVVKTEERCIIELCKRTDIYLVEPANISVWDMGKPMADSC